VLSRLSSGRVAIAKHLDTLMLASLAMLGITLRASSPASLSVLSIVSSLAVLNTAFLLPNDSGEWRVVGVSAASFLTLTLIHITLQGVEPLHTLLIHVTFFAMLLALMAIEYPAMSNVLVDVFTPAIPVTVVLSMILASYVGSRIGVALVMLGLIDLSISLAVVSRWRGAKALTLSILVFILLHTHVALGLGFRQILILLIISVLRVLMLISRKAIFVKILTLADIAVRSVVA